MAKVPVKFYFDTMPGMPQITNNYGDMVNMLDVVLANGTALANVTGVTFADGLITVTTAAAHNFVKFQVIELSGANQTDYNGEFRITEIVSATVFKAAITVVPSVATATGTLRVRIPPLGFEIAFTGANKRAYRSKNLAGTRPYLRVDNSADPLWNSTYTIKARVTAARTMSDVDTFTSGRAPYDPVNPTINETITGSGNTAINGWFTWAQTWSTTGNNISDTSSIAGSTTNRPWMIVGDDKAFYFMMLGGPRTSTTQSKVTYGFGEFESRRPGDQWNYFLIAQEGRVAANSSWFAQTDLPMSGTRLSATTGMILGRSFSGYGYHEKFAACANTFGSNTSSYSGSTACIPYPNGPDFSMWFCPRYIVETSRGDVRGTLPGTYFIPHSITMTDQTVIENVLIDGITSDKKMMLADVTQGNIQGRLIAFDIIGPWRTT